MWRGQKEVGYGKEGLTQAVIDGNWVCWGKFLGETHNKETRAQVISHELILKVRSGLV